jgi:hypothetical protein
VPGESTVDDELDVWFSLEVSDECLEGGREEAYGIEDEECDVRAQERGEGGLR